MYRVRKKRFQVKRILSLLKEKPGGNKILISLDKSGEKRYLEWKGWSGMNPKAREIIVDLKCYLEYLKGIGIETVPFSETRSALPHSSASALSQMTPTLEEIRQELGDCRRCKLHRTRRTLVFGEGPGYDEDVQGRPFVGKAGQLLTKIIESIHLRREEVYIANVIKCRPPQNRNPEPDEIECCHPFLLKQIRAIQPQIICALGAFAAQTLLKTDAKITALRGRFYDLGGMKVLPTYHPAYLLRNPDRKREVWEDMKKISEVIMDKENVAHPAGDIRR